MNERLSFEDFVYYGCMAVFMGAILGWAVQ